MAFQDIFKEYYGIGNHENNNIKCIICKQPNIQLIKVFDLNFI